MENKPRGKCPFCSRTLILEEALLVCPYGDYKVNGQAFEDRWQVYFKAVENRGEGFSAIAESDRLVEDLRSMNITESE